LRQIKKGRQPKCSKKQEQQQALSENTKRKIIEEYLNSSISQATLNQKHSINGHSSILKWIRRNGYQPLR